MWDYTCVDTLAASNLVCTSITAGAAAEKAFRAKELKYDNLMPIAMETLGSWAIDSLRFIQTIGKRIVEHTGELRSRAYLLQRISVAVQRCNAISVMGRLPPADKLNELFYL